MIKKNFGFITGIIIPLILLLPWLIFFYKYNLNPEEGFLNLKSRYHIQNLINFDDSENLLLQGKKITGEFKSKYSNLGTVSVRFETFKRINTDWLNFRIKEKNQPDWYYEASYKTDQFQNNQLFPFGFPLINDSKNKVYIFEIESQEGTNNNYVAIDTKEPVFISKHVFNRKEFKNNIKDLINFIEHKPINFILDNNQKQKENNTSKISEPMLLIAKINNFTEDDAFVSSSFIYLSPFLFYLIFTLKKLKKILAINDVKKTKRLQGAVTLLFLTYHTFVVQGYSQFFLITLIIIWLFISKSYSTKSQMLLIFIFFIISAIFVILKQDILAEKMSIYSYFILLILLIRKMTPVKYLKLLMLKN